MATLFGLLPPTRPPALTKGRFAAARAAEPLELDDYGYGLPSVDDLEVAAAAAMADVASEAPSASSEDDSMSDGDSGGSEASSGPNDTATEQVLRLPWRWLQHF